VGEVVQRVGVYKRRGTGLVLHERLDGLEIDEKRKKKGDRKAQGKRNSPDNHPKLKLGKKKRGRVAPSKTKATFIKERGGSGRRDRGKYTVSGQRGL